MLLRLIILSLVIWLAAVFLSRLLRRGPAAGNSALTRMVRCAHCGLFLPENETIVSGNQFYCSKQHASSARK